MSFSALTIDVNAKLAGLETGLKRVEDMTSRTARHIEGLNSVVGTLKAGFAALGGALTVGALVGQVRAVADLQDQFGKLSQQLGIGVQSLTELDYAAKLSDVSTEELQTGVTRLTSKMADVAQGSKEAASVFDSLGVKVKNTDGSLRSSEEVLKDIAQRFSEFKDGSTKTAYAVEIFGRAGAKLIPLLNSGRAGLAELGEEARRLGIVFDEKAAKAAEQFNDNLTRLDQAAQGLKIELLQGLIPGLTEITQRFIDARAEGIAFIDALDIAANIKGFGTLDEKIADVQRRLEGAKSGQWTGWMSNDVKGLQAELEKLLALKRRVENRETAQHPAGFSTALLGRGGTVGAEPPRLPGSATGAAPRLQQADLTYQQRAVIDAANDYDKASRAAEVFALKLQVLDAKFFEQGGSVEDYTAAVQDLTKATATAGTDGVGALEDFAKGWLDQLDPMREFIRQIELVEKAVKFDFLTPEQAEAIKERLAKALQPLNEADAWAVQAAKNIQDSLGDNLYNILDGNFQNIGKSFGNMLKRMAAEALAADLARSLFGDFAKTGKVGGMAGSFLSWGGGLFGGARAEGGPIFPGKAYLVGERGPELIVSGASGTVVPNAKMGRGGIVVSVTNHFSSNVNRSEMFRFGQQIRESTLAAIKDASDRGEGWKYGV